MAIFLIVLDEDNEEFEARVKTLYPPPQSHKISDLTYFVQSNETSNAIAEKLGLRETVGLIVTGVVYRLNGAYAGYTFKSTWDWLEQAEARDVKG